MMRWPPMGSTCAGWSAGQPANAGEASSAATTIDTMRTFLSTCSPAERELSLGGWRKGRRRTSHRMGVEPEVLAQPLTEVPSVAVVPKVGACRGHVGLLLMLAGIRLGEGRARNQRDQRESSDKRFHDASPCCGRLS